MGSNFNKEVEYIESLISDYRILKKELNELTLNLDKIYSDEDNYPSLEILYDVEDKQFSKLIDCVCVYKDLVTSLNRLEMTEENRFVLRRLDKEVDQLEEIVAEYYFNFVPNKEEVPDDSK